MGRAEKRLDDAIGGIVDEDVETVPELRGALDRRFGGARFRKVASDLRHLATSRACVVGRAVEAFDIDIGDAQPAAASGELDRHLAAEPAGRASDENAWSCRICHDRLLPRLL